MPQMVLLTMRWKRTIKACCLLNSPRLSPSEQRIGQTKSCGYCKTTLLDNPNAGDVIRGSSGLRKLRWAASGRGKRGGARVIYYHYVSAERIYLIYGYVKSDQEDLTPDQIKLLAQLMKDITHG